MQHIVTSSEMQEIDKYTIEQIKIPSMVLMEMAAYKTYSLIKNISRENARCLVVVEGGNNGGDGIAIARMLYLAGYKVQVYYINRISNQSEQFSKQYEIARNLGIEFIDNTGDEYDIIVDAIFGVGLTRNVEGIHAKVISKLNSYHGTKISVDMPTGINATTGKVLNVAFMADYTVTFGYIKRGLVLYPGAGYSKENIVADIGFPKCACDIVSPGSFSYDSSDLCKLPKRTDYSNKGTYGKVAIIAGSDSMAGAAYLSAKAAYYMGSGLVKIVTNKRNRVVLQSLLPEALISVYSNIEDVDKCLEEVKEWADVIVCGPGIGKNDCARRIVENCLDEKNIPIIFDADALNIIGENSVLVKKLGKNTIITPHVKEFSRLTGKAVEVIIDNIYEEACRFNVENRPICVLKDTRTIVPSKDGKAYINISGNNGMATGGSGDVLTGVIAGLIAQNMDNYNACTLGVYIHGIAGDIASTIKGQYSMTASDIIDGIPDVLGGKFNEKLQQSLCTN